VTLIVDVADGCISIGRDQGIVDNWDRNPNLRGPNGNGEPSAFLEITDLNGNPVRIDHHNWGHVFEDDNTFEYPYFHGPNGEHISYIPNE